jgi:t-SNARE complex subunit (syntaxin)
MKSLASSQTIPRATSRQAIEAATHALGEQSERAQTMLRRARAELQHVAQEDALFAQRADAEASRTGAGAGGETTAVQIRRNLHAQASYALAAALQEVRETLNEVQGQLHARSERDLHLLAPQLSEHDVATLIETGQSGEFVRRIMVEDEAPSEALLATVAQVQERHLSILALERQVAHLASLFSDLAFLVDQQQASVDTIAQRIARARDDTERGEEQIQEAKTWQSKARAVSVFQQQQQHCHRTA